MARRKKSSNKATAEGKARGGGGKFQKEPCGDKHDEVRAFAMKKYKRHRGVPASLLSDLQSALEGKHGKLTERKRKGQGKPEAVQAKITRVKGMLGALAVATNQQAGAPPS